MDGEFPPDGFVVEDRCAFTFLPETILLQGTIVCLDALTVDVEKEIAILSGLKMNARVQTRRFRYHARVRGAHNILRYESAHEHRPQAHKHVYNTFGDGQEQEIIDLFHENEIPTLGEVIQELREWHQENAGRLKKLR
jgi:uncharacterized protein with von Willebrand factor type A (vWA) domain